MGERQTAATCKNRQIGPVQRVWRGPYLKKIAIFITRLYYCSVFLITLTQNSIRFHYYNYSIVVVKWTDSLSYETLFQAKTHACCG